MPLVSRPTNLLLYSGGDGNEAFSEAKISFLWNRFHVDLDDERAGQKIRALIQESAKVTARQFPICFMLLISRVFRLQALAPQIFEMAHSIAQFFRQ